MDRELIDLVARAMHSAYEEEAIKVGWNTQESCKVEYDDLPKENKLVMSASAIAAIQVVINDSQKNL